MMLDATTILTNAGGDKESHIDVRFIAAAQPKDIDDQDKLLPDLKYRLGYPNVITMPPLNERLREAEGKMAKFIIKNGSLPLVLTKLHMRDKIRHIEITKDSLNLLSKHEYEGNYRELESILTAAVISAIEDDRTEIQPQDLKLLADKDAKPKETLSSKTKSIPDQIQFKDIFNHADKVRASIVEEKVLEMLQSEKAIKTILKKEGIPDNEYLKFTRLIKKYTGKSISDIKSLK